MKILSVVILILISVVTVPAQATSSAVDVVTTYSQNGKFHLTSVPYDNEFPSLRGKTSVYESGNANPLYVFERGFDSVEDDSNNLVLSNNGEIIFYVIPWQADENREGLKSVTIYKHGTILKSYTETEITGCDKKKERCSLVYSNYDKVIDQAKSSFGTKNYKKTFKDGIDEKEKFLSDFAIFSFDNTVYLTDSKNKVHIFDLSEGRLISSESFDNLFDQIKGKGRFSKTELKTYQAAIFLDFPKLKNGKNTEASLADYLGMKSVNISNRKDEQYKWYNFKINSNIARDGSLEIEEIDVGAELPKDKIVEFFKTNKFDASSVPGVFEKWSLGEEYFFLRKKNDQLARQEKRQEQIEERREFEKRLTLESIEGVYIPKDLGECFVELDKLLSEVDKKEMQALARRDDMIAYHHGLGTWLRNNWGLWGGSRLQKYFRDRGVNHPDEMSGVVLDYYYDWLNGKKDSWKDWSKKSLTTRSVKSKRR